MTIVNAMAQPQFAIIIPSYNYGHYLPEAIESVLSQEGASWEAIIVDDGSTDATADIAARYSDSLAYFRQPNQGPYVACKRGILRTTAPFLIFLDADDRLHPGALAHAAEQLAKRPDVSMLFGPLLTIRPDGSARLGTVPLMSDDRVENFRRYVTGDLKISAGGAVLHRDVLERLRDVPEPFFHGYDRVMVAQGLASFTAIATDTPLLELRMHEGRLRDNIKSALAAGLDAVNALFDPAMTPPEVAHFRSLFESNLLLEQARLLYRHQRYGEARARYARAFRARASTVLQWSNIRRFIYCAVRSAFRSKRPSPHSHSSTPEAT